MMKVNSDEKELIEFRKKFWANVKKIQESKPEISRNKFIKETKMNSNTELEGYEKGKNDFGFDRVYRIKKVLDCSFGDLFSGL